MIVQSLLTLMSNDVIDDNMTEQDFIDFYKIGAKT